MLKQLTGALDFHGQALVLRSERQRTIASNIANADTPGYAARDFNFRAALNAAQTSAAQPSATATQAAPPRHAQHIVLAPRSGFEDATLDYTSPEQPAMDQNSVDLDRERAAFADNAVRYEATLRFINGQARTLLSAIQGQ